MPEALFFSRLESKKLQKRVNLVDLVNLVNLVDRILHDITRFCPAKFERGVPPPWGHPAAN